MVGVRQDWLGKKCKLERSSCCNLGQRALRLTHISMGGQQSTMRDTKLADTASTKVCHWRSAR